MGDFFQHKLALVESRNIGDRTRIWAWAHVLKGARLGEDCNVGEHCFVEGGVKIGSRVTIKNGVSLWDGIEVGDDVFLGPQCVLTNDRRPRSRNQDWDLRGIVLEDGCSIGANATLLAGVRVGRYALVAAASVVVRDVPPYALVMGNPASQRGWVCSCGQSLSAELVCVCGREYTLEGAHVLVESKK